MPSSEALALGAGLCAAGAVGGMVLGCAPAIEDAAGRFGTLEARGWAAMPRRYRDWLFRKALRSGEPVTTAIGTWRWQVRGFCGSVALALAMASLGGVPGVLLLLPAISGALWPLWSLMRRAGQTDRAILRALPNCLDLLTLAVEAGLDLAPAISEVSGRAPPGPLRNELDQLLRQLRLGATREEAFRSLAERVDLEPVSRFCRALREADRWGVGIAKALRAQARQLRVEQAHRAEAAALRLPIKLLLPLFAFILPGTFLVLLGPVAFELFNQVGGR